MSVITISRQLGSMGCEIAQAAAASLGYQVVWRDLINQAAQRAGVPEVALHEIDELNLLGIHPTQEERQAYQQALNQIMREMAASGNVIIVGRAGQIILRDWPDAFHIRLVAPLSFRIKQLIETHNISQEAALAQIQVSDRARKNFLRRYYRVDWESTDLYDLMINTSRLTVKAAAAIICQLVSSSSASSSTSPSSGSCID